MLWAFSLQCPLLFLASCFCLLHLLFLFSPFPLRLLLSFIFLSYGSMGTITIDFRSNFLRLRRGGKRKFIYLASGDYEYQLSMNTERGAGWCSACACGAREVRLGVRSGKAQKFKEWSRAQSGVWWLDARLSVVLCLFSVIAHMAGFND